MVYTGTIAVAAAALLGALPVHAGLYPKSSAVLSIDGKSYDRLIAQSNYTSIVEFYAPWCGHCKNLQPHFEKAALNLKGLAKVAAVDCDEESNKPFCGQFGVKGFPTLKIVRPGKTPGKPVVEDYQGERTAKAIVDAVVDKIPNLVKRVDDKTLEAWLAEANDTAKAILFSDKGKTSALLKAIAIDFKGSMSVAQIRNTDKEKASLELFGITKFPTLLLLPGGKEAQGIVYDGELKKEAMVKFLSQAAEPNQDPAPAKVKVSKSKDSKKTKATKDKFESSSKSKEESKAKDKAASATDETLKEDATESPRPKVDTEKPTELKPEPAPPINIIYSEAELEMNCLGPKTGTCILVLLPANPDALAGKVVGGLSEIEWRHHLAQRKRFPSYAIPRNNPAFPKLHDAFSHNEEVQIIAINARRGWWVKYPQGGPNLTDKDVTETALESFIDTIRLGEGKKLQIPEGMVIDRTPPVVPIPDDAAQQPLKEDAPTEEKKAEEPVAETKAEEKKTEEEAEPHDEL